LDCGRAGRVAAARGIVWQQPGVLWCSGCQDMNWWTGRYSWDT